MIRRSLEMIVQHDTQGRTLLRSPAVGLYTGSPRKGEGLVAGSTAGSLTVLGRTIDLLVPAGVEGVVVELSVPGRSVPVGYGEPVITLERGNDPLSASAGRDRGPAGASAPSPRADGALQAGRGNEPDDPEGIPAASCALRAPTTGVFYARPDPASPPFVSEGSLLEAGQTAGFIEVMKCFSPIIHPGGAMPSPGLVEQVRVREGEEVHPGQILFVLRPV